MALADHIEQVAAMFTAGRTLQEIGDEFGVSRERVRQVLCKRGMTANDGGSRRRARERALDRIAEREEACKRTKGCTLAQFKSIPPKARRAYSDQKANAKRRGIAWCFTVWEWWRVWRESGHWAERGRGAGYVMARKGDVGPYAVDNVYICTVSQNFKDSYVFMPWHERDQRGAAKKKLDASLTAGG